MKSKIQVIGGRVEFNGFRVANLVASLPASIRADFTTYIENVERDAYSRGRKDGYDEGFKEGQGCVDADYTARLR
jgi:hypothetical protein